MWLVPVRPSTMWGNRLRTTLSGSLRTLRMALTAPGSLRTPSRPPFLMASPRHAHRRRRARQPLRGSRKSRATINAYAAGWRDFLQFCERRGADALPATDETVAGYLAELADGGMKAATIARRLVVISQAHRAADLPSPTTSSLVRRTHAGIRRSIGTAQVAKAPAVVSDLKRMVAKLPNTRVGMRDRALLLLGFAGAFRRSELVGLDVADLEFSSAGLVVNLRRAKTDQEAAGRRVGVPYGSSEKTCPVRSLQALLDNARITTCAV